MKNQVQIISTVKNLFALFLVLVTPLFFLPITQEFYTTNKIYFLAFGGLILFILSLVELLLTKKIIWQKRSFDNVFFLFLITTGLSILLTSPNKVQAIFNPNFGLLMLVGLYILYYYLSRNIETIKKINLLNVINITGIIIAVITIFFFFQPFKDVNLPVSFQFLKNPSFTPLGMNFDLAIFLGFLVVLGFSRIIKRLPAGEAGIRTDKKELILNSSLLIVNLIALSLTIYSLLKPASMTLPPFRLSWYAAVETLKNPLTALFGIGVDNFPSIYARVKDFAYNQSTLWQIQSFSVSRSTLLHIFTETGVFGIIAFGLLLLNLVKISLQNKTNKTGSLLVIGYWLLILAFFPPSLMTFFLLAVYLAYLANQTSSTPASSFDLSSLVPLYIGIPVVCFVIIGASGFFLTQVYRSEYYYKLALNGIVNNNLKELYDNQRQAIILNPYFEKYRVNFAQTNLLLANNIINRAIQAAQAKPEENKKAELSAQDQQTVSQAIQAAIAEGKAAVALNPQKAGNWQNLAEIYRSIINFVQGQADAWTVSSYQQAIGLDPQNPNFRLNLGGVYYGFAIYDEAIKMFEQATALKPDWPNAYYNLAWALFQKTDYQKAALNMQNVVYLLDPKKDKVDYDKAAADLVEFKKKVPGQELTPTPAAQQQPAQLILPSTAPTGQVEPPIVLPKEASPEAR